MTPAAIRAGSTAVVVTGVLLIGCLAGLVALAAEGQARLRDRAVAQQQTGLERQAAAIDAALDRHRARLAGLAVSPRISNYFTYRRLGMSLPYGLRASLMAIKRELRQALAAAGHTAFRRIALIEENGHVLLAVGATEHAAAQTYAVQDTARAGPLEVRRSAHGNRLTLTLPVTSEGHSLGFLAADIDAADLLTRHAGDLTDGPGASALLGTAGEILGGRLKPVPTTWPDGAGLPDRGPIRVAVGDSGLHLIADPASPADFFASPIFLIALGLLAIPLLVAIAYVNRLTRRLLGLQDRFDAMRQQQALIGQQNERLQREIDQRVKSEQKLAHQANYDQLTGLPNRNLAIDRLSQAIKWAKREGGRVLTLFLDLDRFKQVNDSLGHAAGDELLREAAQRLQAQMRDSDTVSRLGGDEFLVICPDGPEEADWRPCAEQLLEALATPFYIGDHEFFVGVSIGVAAYPEGGGEPQTLLKNADIAMYAAKDLGRNRYCFYDPSMDAAALEGLRLERNLRHALRHEEFRLAFQPIVDLSSGRTVAVEALLRWHSRELGEVPADRFIPIAEETGLIHEIGEWVLLEACRLVSEIQPDHAFRVAVNLSSRQFSHPRRLLDSVLFALRNSGLMPNQLELEITETILIDDRPEIAGLIDQLDRIGVRLSLDDFGTGYSALNYLQRFPFDVLKIDRSFTNQVPDSSANASLIRAIIAMAHALELEVVAEGIERREQAGFLLVYHCEFGQGHLYSRPMSTEELRLHLIDPQAISA